MPDLRARVKELPELAVKAEPSLPSFPVQARQTGSSVISAVTAFERYPS